MALISPRDTHRLGQIPLFVIPAQAGTQGFSAASPVTLDPRLRGDDGVGAG